MTHIPSPDPTRSPAFLKTWARQPITALTGVVAVVYGVGFAVGWWGDHNTPVAVLGAAVLGALFVGSLLLAYFRAAA